MPLQKEVIKVDIVKIVDNMINYGIKQGASDIHIEPQEDKANIRYRVDGVLQIVDSAGLDIYGLIVGRVKILANISTTGRPRPQEGRIKLEYEKREVDLRVSIFPTTHGETIVLRILESVGVYENYTDLGLSPEQAKVLDAQVRRTFGLVLVTGPTGSGKSTTLFTVLNKLNDPGKSLVTLEDPVERKINMVRQTQVDPEIGLTFATGLRYLLRQDPNIIMVGEIRDKETAQIAVQAAITGHLVLASVHTNNAAGAIIRLINMEIEPFLLASSLRLVTAQRLGRLICPDCKQEFVPTPELMKKINAPQGMKFYQATGCDKCHGRATRGRIGLHEVLVVNKDMRELIIANPSDVQINDLARRQGMIMLREAAFQKVHEGTISIEEALRLTEI
jgi:type IV pilus assembly protein PilB